MIQKLLKNLILVVSIFLTTTTFSQISYNFAEDPATDHGFVAAGCSFTPSTTGLLITPAGDKIFFEVRSSYNLNLTGLTTITFNYIENTTTADSMTFKVGNQSITASKISFTPTQSVYITDDALFTGESQSIRARFNSSAGLIANSTSMKITSMIVDTSATANLTNIFGSLKTTVLSKNGKIIVKNAPEGCTLQIYNLLGQIIKNENLQSGTYIAKISAQGISMTQQVILF